jgi:arginine exporter protein ArgO
MWYNEIMIFAVALLFIAGMFGGELLYHQKLTVKHVIKVLGEAVIILVFSAMLYWGYGYKQPCPAPTIQIQQP